MPYNHHIPMVSMFQIDLDKVPGNGRPPAPAASLPAAPGISGAVAAVARWTPAG